MKLSRKQAEWLNKEMEVLERILETKPERGLLRYLARLDALQTIADIHNLGE